jgi:hypothetical protein
MHREPRFVLRRRRTRTVKVARLLIQLERAVARPQARRTHRVSLRNV